MERSFHTAWVGNEFYYFDEIDSTNAEAKRLAQKNTLHGTVVAADKQSAGKGRHGRSWQSPSGRDIYFSIILKPDFSPECASGLTLVMALAVSRAVEEHCGIRAQIKWPNDVVVNGKKVCGILTEMCVETAAISYVIIGTGINVNRQDTPEEFPKEIRNTATSLFLEKGTVIDRESLLQKILQSFEAYYGQYVKHLSMEQLLEEYNTRLVNRNRQVRVLDPKGEWGGIARGINRQGELLVEKENGTVMQVYAGEVSVRGLYGYV